VRWVKLGESYYNLAEVEEIRVWWDSLGERVLRLVLRSGREIDVHDAARDALQRWLDANSEAP